MGWFGPSKDEMWRTLADQIGADFVAGGFWSGSKVQAHVGPWTITLDTFVVSTGKSSHTYTRMRSPFVNPGGFRFSVRPAHVLTPVAKLLGFHDIEIGDPEFDEAFILQGNDPERVIAFFANPRLRSLIRAQPHLALQVKDDEGWFHTRFPDGVDELYFQAGGVVKEVGRLKGLFDLFAEALHQLTAIDSATKDDPGVNL